ncbi:MAG: hypothetical protein CVV56_02060 [Tenericutes bacterium HGW-Tenericutes-1]|jgi:hypothetical protein|nr:MAG: hypothetical protein CVV56_02060 [Tenericutes bacterium HGW-Tenericutes-1]
MKKTKIISILLFAFFLLFTLGGCDFSSDELGENEVKVLNSESTFVGSDYEEVVEILQEWGFTNIETEVVYDIVWGFTPEGSTKSVSIDGSNTFIYGDIFDKDVLIVVTYSMRVEDEPEEPIDENEVRVLSSESSFIGQNYEMVVGTLEGWGFTNIITVPVYDIIFDITQPGSTKEVKIGGIDNYKNGDIFDKDIEIIITYSMRDDDAPKYTITWEVNGVIVETDNNVIEGSTPNYNGTTPTKADAQFNYSFVGWSPTISSVTQNQNYVAIIEQESVKEYTITWKDGNNSTLGTTKVPYGNLPSYNLPADTAQWDYIDWTPSITEVNANATYTAYGELMEYEITWNDYDETFLGMTIVPYGTTPSYDLPNDTEDRYYIGWSPEFASVNGSATYTAITVNFSKEFAFRAAVVAFTNYYADDIFTEDGNSYDMSKLHDYSDINGFFLYIDDEGIWTVKDDNTWHVSNLKMTLPYYHTKIDVSLDVSFDMQDYIVSNLSGEAPSYSDFDSRYSSMQVLESDSWFVITSHISLDMINNDRTVQPKYRPMYIDINGEHLFLTYLIMDSLFYPDTYYEVSTEWIPVIYSNIELLQGIFDDNISVGDFIIKIEFMCNTVNNDTIYVIAYGIEYNNGEVILVSME